MAETTLRTVLEAQPLVAGDGRSVSALHHQRQPSRSLGVTCDRGPPERDGRGSARAARTQGTIVPVIVPVPTSTVPVAGFTGAAPMSVPLPRSPT